MVLTIKTINTLFSYYVMFIIKVIFVALLHLLLQVAQNMGEWTGEWSTEHSDKVHDNLQLKVTIKPQEDTCLHWQIQEKNIIYSSVKCRFLYVKFVLCFILLEG